MNLNMIGARLGMEIPLENPGAGCEAEIRIRDVNARKLADDSEDPGDQDTPENISFDILLQSGFQ